ncbi:hypothetical protein A3K72_00995 [Candidatus Woesearchaeota archaeon RBG_13_36_6]|nr:MAG: hypothetical protein A3K72_00995 [Candidatus Woesearchaeota archaeon RBG_13_36_6]
MALKSIANCDFPKRKYEVVVVYEQNNNVFKKGIIKFAKKQNLKLKIMKIPSKKGLGFNRNMAVKNSRGRYLAFTDADCKVPIFWLKLMYNEIKKTQDNVAAVVGGLKIPKYSFLSDSISKLGFPAGGSIGFERMFYVDENSFTNHISTGNCIIKRKALVDIGNFDVNCKGIEDKDLALRLIKKKYKIKYLKGSYVFHPPNKSFKSFLKRNFIKGRDSYFFVIKHKGQIKTLGQNRLKSLKNILSSNVSIEFPFILFLLVISYLLESAGYFYAMFLYFPTKVLKHIFRKIFK